MTEIYGFKLCRRAIWLSLMFNFIFLLYSQLVVLLPGPPYAIHNEIYDAILAANSQILFASTISYLLGQFINALIISKSKIMFSGQRIACRFVFATFIAAGIDSFIFGAFAFYGSLQNMHLIYLILTMWFLKVIAGILSLPLVLKFIQNVKQKDKLDIYDTQTKFSIFALDVDYYQINNHYEKNR